MIDEQSDDSAPKTDKKTEAKAKAKTRAERRTAQKEAIARLTAERVPVKLTLQGRPRLLDPDQATLDKNIVALVNCGITHHTLEETAAVLGCSIDCLRDFFARYPEAFDKFKDAELVGNSSLKRNQFALSAKSAQMAIYLGEQRLGQRDPYKMRELEMRQRALDQKDAEIKMRERELVAREEALERQQGMGFGDINISALSTVQLQQLLARLRGGDGAKLIEGVASPPAAPEKTSV